MADELVFRTYPMSRGRIVRRMLEEIGTSHPAETLDYRATLKAPACPAIDPIGKMPAPLRTEQVNAALTVRHPVPGRSAG